MENVKEQRRNWIGSVDREFGRLFWVKIQDIECIREKARAGLVVVQEEFYLFQIEQGLSK